MPGLLTMTNGTEVRFEATDNDLFAPYRTVQYEFFEPDADVLAFFSIDEQTGSLILKRPLVESEKYYFDVSYTLLLTSPEYKFG